MKYLISNINDYSNNYINKFYNNINIEKRTKIDKLVNKKDKYRSIIGEILLSKLIDNYTELLFKTNKNGKPYIINKNIYYNISHSNDFIICAISNKEIGIDIEKIKTVNLNIINKFATDKEKKYILSNKDKALERLYQIYTLKESYIKCLGDNMTKLLDIEFIIDNNITCSDKNIKSYTINDINGYSISICEKISV